MWCRGDGSRSLDDGSSHTAHLPEDLDLRHPTFATPDLTTFCRLDELGLEAIGQLIEPDRAVLECRVVDDDPWCRKCGAEGMRPLLVSKLRGLGVSLGLPLACPSFSGPESFFGGWGSAPFLGSLWCWLFLVFGYESPGGFPVVAPVL